MAETQKNQTPHAAPPPPAVHARRVALGRLAPLALACLCVLSFAAAAEAQQKFSKTYRPARRSVRLQLTNLSGTVEVEGWDRGEIRVVAEMESPAAKFVPVQSDDGLVIDVVSAARGRSGVGDVNFRISVPEDATVDVETRRGNISVRNVRGALVRAVVTTEGDIDLTSLRADRVLASNISGNILFDADLKSGGSYDLRSMQGDISVRLGGGSGFTLTAVAPRTRNINLGGFASRGQFDFSDHRKIKGTVGDGSATLNTTNMRGSIVFVSR
jgi:hypothetical protein